MDTGTAPSGLHPFRFRTPDEVSLLVQSTFSDQLSHAAACRTAVTEVDIQDAHFPLYCTPYYGYSPTTSVDLKVEILQLSNHLVSSLSLLSLRWKMTLYLPHPIYFRSWPRYTPIYYKSAQEKVSSSAHSLTLIIPTNRSPAGSIVLEGRLPLHSPSF